MSSSILSSWSLLRHMLGGVSKVAQLLANLLNGSQRDDLFIRDCRDLGDVCEIDMSAMSSRMPE